MTRESCVDEHQSSLIVAYDSTNMRQIQGQGVTVGKQSRPTLEKKAEKASAARHGVLNNQ